MNFINFFFYNNEQSARVEEPDNEGIGCTSRRINVQSHKKFLLIVEKKEKWTSWRNFKFYLEHEWFLLNDGDYHFYGVSNFQNRCLKFFLLNWGKFYDLFTRLSFLKLSRIVPSKIFCFDENKNFNLYSCNFLQRKKKLGFENEKQNFENSSNFLD